ncbi:MAG: hypothetical protein ACRDWI_14450 [Jiangellaceae bacterium]
MCSSLALRSGQDPGPIWEGDEAWFAMQMDQAVVALSPATDRPCMMARDSAPAGGLLGKRRKIMPTGSERTVGGMGDGSTLDNLRDE